MAGRGFGLFFLHQFQPIAEGVPQFEAVKAWDGDRVQKGGAVFRQMATPGFQVLHLVGQVGLGSVAVHPVLRSDVDLHIPEPEPESAPAFQTVGLGNLSEPHHFAVKMTGLLFRPSGDGDLCVVNAERLHLHWLLRI